MEEKDRYFDKIVCEECGHIPCRSCEWEGEDGRVCHGLLASLDRYSKIRVIPAEI